MSNTTLRLSDETLAALRGLAFDLGYTHRGEGNLTGLLVAIAANELRLVPADGEPVSHPASLKAHIRGLQSQVSALADHLSAIQEGL